LGLIFDGKRLEATLTQMTGDIAFLWKRKCW